LAKALDPAAAHARVRIARADHDARDAGFEQGVHAGRSLPVMRARLERDVHRRAARALAGRAKRVHLRVRSSVALVPSLAADPPVPAEHRPDERVRIRPAATPLGKLDRTRNRQARAWTRRRYARGRSSRPKMLVPATSSRAPAR